jgi:hypothetical protein
MSDESLIATFEQSLRQTRNAQNRLMIRLREFEAEADRLRMEIGALENCAAQTEKAIDSLLVTMRSGNRSMNIGKSIQIDDDYEARMASRKRANEHQPNIQEMPQRGYRRDNPVAYLHQNRGIPSITNDMEPISHRFSDRTITQACTLLLREAAGPLHVNELYNLLIAGGMKFKGNNPTISVAVSLSRNRRFRKVGPGTFDLVIREAIQAAS